MEVVGADVSFYQDDDDTPRGIDFQKMALAGDFVIIRVGQNKWVDPDFQRNWSEARLAGIPRGSYWYYDSRVSPDSQAVLCCEALKDDPGELPLFADFEETYGGPFAGWKNWKIFLEKLTVYLPGKEKGIYTGYYYWIEKGPQTEKDWAWFGKYPLWIARYKASSPLVPEPFKDWTYWQFSDSELGEPWGVESANVDLNYFNGTRDEFRSRYSLDASGENKVESWFQGKVTYEAGWHEAARRDGSLQRFYSHVVRFKIADVERVNVSDSKHVRSTPYYLESRGCQIAINGDEAHYPAYSDAPRVTVKGLGLSDGVLYKNKSEESNVQWGADNQILGMDFKVLPGAWNAVGGSNILLEAGQVSPFVDDVSVDPRTSIFWNETEYILIMIDGRNNGTQGLTRRELSVYALSLGATNGHNLDGGDSCTLVFADGQGRPIIKNNPPEGYAHQLANHVGFWIKQDGTGGNGMTTHKVLKKVGLRSEPTMYGTSLRDIPAGKEFTPLRDAQSIIDEGEESVLFIDYKGEGWMPWKWKGVQYLTELNPSEPPVEPPLPQELPDVPVTVVLGDDVNYEKQTITAVLKAVK